ncbi:hypothetical protein BGZ50_006561 [Haplosporangium sp. Z 11]|nr:hypothetical protein BGZ50_006561 [Haplosporangium sp. Z 11]
MEVEILRREADCLVNFLISENADIMKDYGGVIEPISCGYIDPPLSQMFILSRRSFAAVRNLVTEDPDTVVPILFEKMASLARTFLPEETQDSPICLFNEQYIVKTPKSGSTSQFEWHQDAQYMDQFAQDSFPIVSCWTALDDVNQMNGTLLIEPFPRPLNTASETYFDLPASLEDPKIHLQYHQGLASCYKDKLDKNQALTQALDRRTKNMTSRPLGSPLETLDPQHWESEIQRPILVQAPAGSTVFLSGFVRHCSLGNTSSKFRRAYMPQFSAGAVVAEDGRVISLAVPVTDPHVLENMHYHEDHDEQVNQEYLDDDYENYENQEDPEWFA